MSGLGVFNLLMWILAISSIVLAIIVAILVIWLVARAVKGVMDKLK